MKKLIAIIAAVLMLGQSLCYAGGIEKDKAEHFGAGVAIDTAEAVIFPKWTPLERFLGGLTGEGMIGIVHKTW